MEEELREIGCSRFLKESRQDRFNEAIIEKEKEDDDIRINRNVE